MKMLLALTSAFSFVLVGCVSDDESVAPSPPVDATFKAVYVPLGGLGPFPTDLFFSGSTDGTLNVPVTNPADVSDYLVAMNGQDGYSTTAPIFVPFSDALDPATVSNSDVIILDSTSFAGLVPGTDYSVSVSAAVDGASNLQITLLRPLAPKHRFIVVVTRSVANLDGDVAVPDTTFQTLLDVHSGLITVPPELTAVNAAVDPLLDAAVAFLGVPDVSNLVTFSFLTQSTTDVMTLVNTQAVAGTVAGLTAVGTTFQLISAGPGYATVYQGVISVPYYQSATSAMTAHWQTATGAEVTRYTAAGAVGPAATATLNVPILISIPNGASPGLGTKPVNGWPTVIFQHGITGNRTNMLGLADAAASANFAVIAIDQPLHGLVTSGLKIVGAERTFDLDVSNNTTGAPGADGVTDASGQNYINLSSLLTSRDNLRQSAADLIRVAKSVSTISYDGIAGGDFDISRLHFVGHSLGAIVGTVFLGVNTDVQAATLGMPGGTIGRLLRDSATFAPRINAGLASNGVVNGTQLYEQFMQAAQTAVDAGDPINFAAAANANHALHLIQVVGNGGANLPDQVVPNSATARLIAALGLAKRSANGANAADGYVNFTAGDHSSLLSPAGSAAANGEMLSEVANFLGSNGGFIVINTASGVIEP